MDTVLQPSIHSESDFAGLLLDEAESRNVDVSALRAEYDAADEYDECISEIGLTALERIADAGYVVHDDNDAVLIHDIDDQDCVWCAESELENGECYTTEDFCTFRTPDDEGLTVPEDADWRTVVKAHMDAAEFWPSVLQVSDHGDVSFANWSSSC